MSICFFVVLLFESGVNKTGVTKSKKIKFIANMFLLILNNLKLHILHVVVSFCNQQLKKCVDTIYNDVLLKIKHYDQSSF